MINSSFFFIDFKGLLTSLGLSGILPDMAKRFRFNFIRDFMGKEKYEEEQHWNVRFKRKKKKRPSSGGHFPKKPHFSYSGSHHSFAQRHYQEAKQLCVLNH